MKRKAELIFFLDRIYHENEKPPMPAGAHIGLFPVI